MAKSDYVPTADNDFLAWLDNFIAQVEPHRAELGVSEVALATLKAAGVEAHAKFAANTQAHAAAHHATGEKNASRPAADICVPAIARQIKVGDNYTEALGALLGIIGPEGATDYANLKLIMTGIDQTGVVAVISFPKLRGNGININVIEDVTGAYVFLARDTLSPYIDNRPLRDPTKPELRRYTAVYVLRENRGAVQRRPGGELRALMCGSKK